MAMSTGGGGHNQTLSEINVTPLVDVMLVLLIIFMVTSSVESVRVERELEQLRQETVEEEVVPQQTHPSQKVPVDLPKVNADRVNLSEERKLVLSVTPELDFYLGDTRVLSCAELPGRAPDADSGELDDGYRACLTALEAKLLDNEKLQRDGELYLRADRAIPYGKILAAMARVRKAGITKFGLVAEPDLEE